MLVAAAALVACHPAKKAAPPAPPPAPAPAVPTAAVSNVYDDFPDPFVLENTPTGYRAASTNSDLVRMPTVTATDLGSWSQAPDLLQGQKPAWASAAAGFWWAPAVWDAPAGGYVLYYTVRHLGSGKQCIGGATAAAPGGPYTVTGAFNQAPVVCPVDLGGAIDPSVFIDPGGQAWLLWKNDGNGNGVAPYIWATRLSDDGTDLVGTATRLTGVTQAWEFGTNVANTAVEGPSMIVAGGTSYLFYSGSDWASARYATGYAVCAPPATQQPCIKPQDGPILASGANGLGPGGAEAFVDAGGQHWLAYHAWDPSLPIGTNGDRRLHLTRFGFTGGVPTFGAGP